MYKILFQYFFLTQAWLKIKLKNVFPGSGKKVVKKLIILTYGRTGSTWLTTSLDYHINTFNHGEVSGEHSDKPFFTRYPPFIKTAFIKYIYPLSGKFLPAYAEDESFYYLHLIRNNPLKIFISESIASETGIWSKSVLSNSTNVYTSIHLDVESAISFIEEYKIRINQINEWGAGRKNFSCISYEEMVSNNEKMKSEIQDFLGLPKRKLWSGIIKQNQAPIHKIVLNYDELEAQLKLAEMSYLLDE